MEDRVGAVIQPAADGGTAQSKAMALWNQQAKNEGRGHGPTVSYDEDEFYCRATDTKGHGKRVGFEVPPHVYAQVMQFVHDDAFPDYQSPADVFRDAVVHLMAKRREQIVDPAFREGIDQLQRDVAFDREVQAMAYNSRQWQYKEAELRASLIQLEKVKAWGQMDTVLHHIESWAEGIAEPYASLALELVGQWREKMPTVVQPSADSQVRTESQQLPN